MWRRMYWLLIAVRLYFALSPSYLHPDEFSQGPEIIIVLGYLLQYALILSIISGQLFNYPVNLTWEFTSTQPVRSLFTLWLIYGLPLLLLRSVWTLCAKGNTIAPPVIFWALRGVMFLLSFVLEDWAIQQLIQTRTPLQRRVVLLLVASSYVTWTYQTRTFSNAVETLLLAWSLVLIQHIIQTKPSYQRSSSILAPCLLGFLVSCGVFNRITFPAFLLVSGFQLVPHFLKQPSCCILILLSGIITSFLAICTDTIYYSSDHVTLSTILRHPIITPLNNLLYNLSPSNLAQHGLHPYYQHFVANLSQLLGPAYLLLLTTPLYTVRLVSAISGIAILSLFQHQEARFLIPAIPLILSSVQLPKLYTKLWLLAWVTFNTILGVVMGTYHQGGIIPAQMFIAGRDDATEVIWWRCYSPPAWLLAGKNENMTSRNLMGLELSLVIEELSRAATYCETGTADQAKATSAPKTKTGTGIYLIAPLSSTVLDQYVHPTIEEKPLLHFEQVWEHRRHVNLDDLDILEDGIWETLCRVVGRRGLAIWRVTKDSGYD